MSEKNAEARPSREAIVAASERLQWNPETPSAFVLEWARTLDRFAAVAALRARVEEARYWGHTLCDSTCTSHAVCRRIYGLEAQLAQLEWGKATSESEGTATWQRR